MDLKEFVGGGISGMAGVVAGQPLDTIRVRIQKLAFEERSHKQSSGLNSTLSRGSTAAVAPMSSILVSMINREGILSPFKGMLFPLLTAAFQNAVVFQAKAWSDDALDFCATFRDAPAAHLARAAIEAPSPPQPLLSTPLTESSPSAKSHQPTNKPSTPPIELQSQLETPRVPPSPSLPSPQSISSSLPPPETHSATSTVAVDIGLQFIRNFISGCAAGGLQTLISCPVELVKIQRQLQSEPLTGQSAQVASAGGARNCSPFTIVRNIVKYEGIKGLFRGFEATFIRDAPSFGLYFAMYPPIRDGLFVLGHGRFSESACSFFAGGFVGAFTWAVIYPLDSIKTRLQSVSRQAFLGIMDAYNAEKNKAALWKGLTPTLMRGFVVNAAIFATYEASMKLMGGRGLV